jgi:hypothetical protein
MQPFVLVLFTLLLLVPAEGTLDDKKDKEPPDKKPVTPAEEYRALDKEFSDKARSYSEAARAAMTAAERQKAFHAEEYAVRMLTLAENNTKDPVGLDAASWVLRTARGTPSASKAVEIIFANYVENPKVGRLCLSLVWSGFSPTPQAEKLMRGVLEKSKNHEAQGMAAYALGSYLKDNKNQGAAGEDDKRTTEMEALFERVEKDFADIKTEYRNRSLGVLAKAQLFELRNLGIGKVAPDIEGEDVDGKKFKLSDYRGKVVVLDFWGTW